MQCTISSLWTTTLAMYGFFIMDNHSCNILFLHRGYILQCSFFFFFFFFFINCGQPLMQYKVSSLWTTTHAVYGFFTVDNHSCSIRFLHCGQPLMQCTISSLWTTTLAMYGFFIMDNHSCNILFLHRGYILQCRFFYFFILFFYFL